MILLDIDDPKGCFECECRLFYRFDGDESHYICPLIKLDENTYKEVSDDGEKDEDCPIRSTITEKECRTLKVQREIRERMEKRAQQRREHGVPGPKPYDADFGVPVYLED